MAATARLVRESAEVLAPGGLFAMEVDTRRASVAAELVLRERRFRSVRIELDLTGRERFVLARRQEKNFG
jgi:release factor glutamine methyltransferase